MAFPVFICVFHDIFPVYLYTSRQTSLFYDIVKKTQSMIKEF